MKGQWNGHFNQLTAAWSKILSSLLLLVLFKVFLFTASSGAFDSHGVTKSLPSIEQWAGSQKAAFDQGLALIRDGVRVLSSSALLLGWCWRHEGRFWHSRTFLEQRAQGRRLNIAQHALLSVFLLEQRNSFHLSCWPGYKGGCYSHKVIVTHLWIFWVKRDPTRIVRFTSQVTEIEPTTLALLKTGSYQPYLRTGIFR